MSDNNNQNYQENSNVQAAVTAALADEKKKKKKKKLIIFAVIAVVIIAIVAIGGSGSKDDTKSDSSGNSVVDAKGEQKPADTLGDYKCVVKEAKLTKDWTNKDAVIVVYEFTNNSQKAISFDVALSDKVYQNGVGLETAILEDGTDILDVDIKPGTTKEVKKAYVLRDKETDLEVEIEELISFSNEKLTSTVKIK